MNAVRRPIFSTHNRISKVLIAGVAWGGLAAASMLASPTANAYINRPDLGGHSHAWTTPAHRRGPTDPGPCQELRKFTPGSPAFFRLAEEIAAHGACGKRHIYPPTRR
jgi:hypothetical protein